MKKFLTSVALLAVGLSAYAQDNKADNTGKNKRDASAKTLTPPDQSNASEDIRITADIRKALVADGSLTSNAKNIKIITTTGGMVTLRGPVASEDEKSKIESAAKMVTGIQKITNEIEITKP